MKKQIFAACLLGSLTLPAAAEGFYLHGDLGQTTLSAGDVEETKTGFSLGGGYNLNDNIAFEATYRDLGKVSDSYEAVYQGYDLDVTESYAYSAVQISALGKLPLNDSFTAYGRLGFAKLREERTVAATAIIDGSSASKTRSESATKAVYGVGARYTLNDQVGIRLEYNKFADWDALSISAVSLGVDYSF